MKKEIIMAAAAAAASLVYLVAMRKMRKAMKEDHVTTTPGQRGHLTNVFSKAKGFKSL
jgi:hypothetical protein